VFGDESESRKMRVVGNKTTSFNRQTSDASYDISVPAPSNKCATSSFSQDTEDTDPLSFVVSDNDLSLFRQRLRLNPSAL